MRLHCERTKCYGDKATKLEIHTATLHYSASLKSWWIALSPGVTGSESISLGDLLKSDRRNCEWPACAGTEGSWDKLIVPASEMERLRDTLRLLQPILTAISPPPTAGPA